MKTIISILLLAFSVNSFGQDAYQQQLAQSVDKLDQAKSVGQYQVLANEFARIANSNPKDWMAPYYAAFCNAKIGWIYNMDNPDKIEPFAALAEQQIEKAEALVDATTQKSELAEVYVIRSMVYRAKVFINPMANGKKFGPLSQQYLDKAKALNAENPRAGYVEAWVKFYTPKMWGGDKNAAKELAEKSLQLLQHQPESNTAPRWGKAECEELLKQFK